MSELLCPAPALPSALPPAPSPARPTAAPDAASSSRFAPVAVRALCAFTAKAGDLDLRFTPAPSAREGIEGHRIVARRRSAAADGASWDSERTLAGQHRGLVVRGRADGVCLAQRRIEEVKTHRGDLARMPDNQRTLHWAQLRVYGALLCREEALPGVTLALVYYDVGNGEETLIETEHGAPELQAFFETLCERYLGWAEAEAAHRQARDAALGALAFPLGNFRPGQRELAEACWRTVRRGGCLLAEAPTGIGKTLGTLFASLKALPAAALDKLLFLTAKTPGRAVALQALDTLARPPDGAGDAAAGAPQPGPVPLPLRVLELVAREKACVFPDRACHGESCPRARGFYDRLPAARRAALPLRRLDAAAVQALAEAHDICPYYLSQELVRWADVVVADYNHVFDLSAFVHLMALENQWRCVQLVDEAHNLVERGREMYSAELTLEGVRHAKRGAPKAIGRALARLQRAGTALVAAQPEPYRAYDAVPAAFTEALRGAAAACTEHLAEHPEGLDAPLQQLYFQLLQWLRLIESMTADSLFDLAHGPGRRARQPDATLCLRNLRPAPHLAPRFAAAHATLLFSATLAPAAFYTDMLGLPARCTPLVVGSPFEAAQLAVRIERVSTRWRDRDQSLAALVAAMRGQYQATPGNYLAFFSSFDYLQRAADALAAACPHLPQWRQQRSMGEAERSAFLARFTPGGRGIAFAVLGGAFGEGIDLPGDRLIGAFVATLGLPPVNPVHEEMRRRLDAQGRPGWENVYLYPGLRKVVQAAGRVIRTRTDQGALLLLDERFLRPQVRALLPGWWAIGR